MISLCISLLQWYHLYMFSLVIFKAGQYGCSDNITTSDADAIMMYSK